MSKYESIFTLLVFFNILWYGITVLLLIICLLLGLLGYKKKLSSGFAKKFRNSKDPSALSSFFYGNLDAIKQHILQNSPIEAAMYVTEFTNLLRTLSNNSKQKSISLAQEIERILLYLELEKKRIGESFVFFRKSMQPSKPKMLK